MKEVKVYAVPGVSVRYDAARCIHAAECVHGLPSVFDLQARPWIQPHKASAAAVAAVVARCPSGALHASYDDGRAAEEAPGRNEVRMVADGPHHLRGDIEIRSDDGAVLARDTRMALCRCGASGNKPYCDNSHVAAAATMILSNGAASGRPRLPSASFNLTFGKRSGRRFARARSRSGRMRSTA